MRMQGIDEALARILANTGIGRFELIGFDACLMGRLEVFSAVAPHARYAVASEEAPSPGDGGALRCPKRTSVFGPDVPPSYIDLDHLAGLLAERAGDAKVTAAGRQLRTALDRAESFREFGSGAAPRPFNPRRGDRFTPLLRLYRPAGGEGAVVEKAVVRSNTLKWRQGLRWEAVPLLPGAYLVGFVVEDMDGQLYRRYAPLGVEKGS